MPSISSSLGQPAGLNAAGHRVFLLTALEGHAKHVGGGSARIARLLALGEADAALLGDRSRVHQVRPLVRVGKLVERAGHGSVADERRLPLGDLAAVAEADLLHAALAGLRQEGSQTLAERDVRQHLLVLFLADGRHVDRVLDDALGQVLADLQRDLHADGFLRLVGRTRDVRRQDDVRQRRQWRVLQRLMAVDIERRAAQLSGLQGLDDGRLVQQLAASAIHQAHALLHLAQRVGVDHALWSAA